MRRNNGRDEELDPIAGRLRDERPQIDPLRLDQIKTSVRSRAQRGGQGAMRRRLAVAGLTVGLMAAATGGVIAAGGAGQSSGNAAIAQYGQGGSTKNHHAQTRSIRIHIKVPPGVRLRRVTLRLNGKVILVLTGHNAKADIEAKLPCGKGTLKVTAITAGGKKITETQKLLACS